jgi:hypothetical protein
MDDTNIKKKRYSLALIVFSCIMILGIIIFIYETVFGIGNMFVIGYKSGYNSSGLKYNLKKHYEFNIQPKNNKDLVTDLVNTDIEVEKSSDAYVHIVADVKIKSSKLKKIPKDFFAVTKSNGINIYEKRLTTNELGFSNSTDSSMTIEVPDKLFKKLYLSTTNGDVSVSKVSALLDMNSTNGDLTTDGIDSNLKASTTNGDINADFNVPKVNKVRLNTTNGEIYMRGLEFKNAHFDFETTNGEVKIPSKFSNLIDEDKDNILNVEQGNGKSSYKAYSTNGDITFKN